MRIVRTLASFLSPAAVSAVALVTVVLYPLSPLRLGPGESLTLAVALAVFAQNLLLYLVVYGGAYGVLYSSAWGRAAFAHLKINPEVPTRAKVRAEARHTLTSSAIGSMYEIGLAFAATAGVLPRWPGAAEGAVFWLAFPAVFLWVDLHFYATHRLLHVQPLYRVVHSLHHRSTRPDPWSGLSFHPLEAAVYFSALAVALVVPLHPWHVVFLKRALDVGPVFGHLGYRGWLGGSRFHDLHHTRGNVNFGATILWDLVFRTYRRPERAAEPRTTTAPPGG